MITQSATQFRAVCPHDCPDTCGMIVSVDNNRAIDLRGDREHPFTRGGLCPKVAPYLERVYHPDRLKWPMRRTGPKGAGAFERITWDEAIDVIARRFRALADSEYGPEAILPYSYCGTMGVVQGSSLDRRFFHRLGASRLDRTICASAGAAGSAVTLGTHPFVDPETVCQSRYIINWGSNTKVTNSHLWILISQARRNGAKVITIDPYKSETACRSDWWLPIRPGTDAALALGMMHVIWRDNLQDDDYLERYCLGADQLRARALQEYPPEKVAENTGISVADIEKLAREYATHRPSFIRVNYGLQRHYGGGMALRTLTCLPAVVGSWREVGGGMLLSTSKMFPWNTRQLEFPPGMPARNSRVVNMVQLAEALLGELPGPPVQSLYVYNCNPAAICPDQSRVLQGLSREDLFTVVHEQFPTDTADYADILLPATTQLEQFDIHGSYGHLYVQVNEQAIEPLAEAKRNTEVFRLLARKLGFEAEFFELSDEELAQQALSSNGKEFDGITLDRLRRDGPIRINVPENHLPFAAGAFKTESGKCEFVSEQMAKRGLDPLPAYTPPCELPNTDSTSAARFPLQMVSPPAKQFLNSSFVNIESLRAKAGEPTVQIHPKDAASRNVADGQQVRVFNDRGSFEVRAVVSESVRPGVVVAESVWWNKFSPGGRNCNCTTSTRLTDLGGGATFFDNLVEIALI